MGQDNRLEELLEKVDMFERWDDEDMLDMVELDKNQEEPQLILFCILKLNINYLFD